MMAAVVLGIFYSSVLRVDILSMLQWTIVGSEAHLSLLIVTLDWLYILLVSWSIDVFSHSKATRRDKIRGHKKDTNQTIKVAPVVTLSFMHYVWCVLHEIHAFKSGLSFHVTSWVCKLVLKYLWRLPAPYISSVETVIPHTIHMPSADHC